MKIGFVGVKSGMSKGQELRLGRLLQHFGGEYLIHGDTRESDIIAHEIAREMNYKVEIYPTDVPDFRAFMDGDIIHEPQKFLSRYRAIVENSDLIIGVPSSNSIYDHENSGVWNSINNCIFQKKTVFVISPKGNVYTPDLQLSSL